MAISSCSVSISRHGVVSDLYVMTWAGWALLILFLLCTTLCVGLCISFAQSDARRCGASDFARLGLPFPLVCSGVTVIALKHLFGPHRPEKLFEEGLYGFAPFSGNTSFPSGHANHLLQYVGPGLSIPYRALWVSLAVCIASRVSSLRNIICPMS